MLEIGDGVVLLARMGVDEGVAAGAASENIVAVLAADEVVAVAARQRVVEIAAEESIIAARAHPVYGGGRFAIDHRGGPAERP